MNKFGIFTLLLAFLFLTGCASEPTVESTQTVSEVVETQIFSPPEETAEPLPSLVSLNVWLGTNLVESYEDPAYLILSTRIEEFNSLNPGIIVSIRIKEMEGPGGILESMRTANASAPLAAPDLIAVDQYTFSSLNKQGDIWPIYSDLEEFLDADDYYEVSLVPAVQNDSLQALPFGADLLVLQSDLEAAETPPAAWSDVYQTPTTFAFAAADKAASFPLTLYLAVGNGLYNDDGSLTLNENALISMFDFFSQTRARGLMPYSTTLLDSSEAVQEAFGQGTFGAVIDWSSSILEDKSSTAVISSPPTLSGSPFSLANVWYWAAVSNDSTRTDAAKELAIFLSDPAFLTTWAEETELLPVRKSAYPLWEDQTQAELYANLLRNSSPLPPENAVKTLGPIISEFTIQIIKNESTNEEAAQAIIDLINK